MRQIVQNTCGKWAMFLAVLFPIYGFSASSGSTIDSTSYNSDVNILIPSNISVCYNDRLDVPIIISFENLGNVGHSNLQMGWYINDDLNGSISWMDTIQPGSSQSVVIDDVTFPGSGSFNVSLWVSNSGFSSSTYDSVVLYVNVLQPFVIDELSDTTVCENSNLHLAVSSGYSYEWNTGEQSNQKLVNTAGLYYVSITDENGCQAIDSVNVLSYSSPGPLLPGDTVLCDGQILQMNVGPGFTSVLWNNVQSGYSLDVSSSGTYSVVVVDSNGCYYEDTVIVQVASTPQSGIVNQIILCQGDSVTINAASSYSSYSWSTGDTSNSIVISTGGSYIVTVVGAYGCIGIDTVDVMVTPLPSIQFSDAFMCNTQAFVLDIGWFNQILWSNGDTLQSVLVNTPGTYTVTVIDGSGCSMIDSVEVINTIVSVDLGNDTSLCPNQVLFFNLNPFYDQVVWDIGNTGGVHQINTTGLHSVTVTNGMCSSSDEILVTVLPNPSVSFTEVVTSPSVQFTNQSNVSTGLLWDFGDGTNSPANNPLHQYQNNGVYEVTLTATNICGVDSVTSNVGIYPQGNHSIYLNSNLSLFPTASSDIINFKLSSENQESINYTVYDVTGKLIIQKEEPYYGADYQYTLDISTFALGTYYLRISNGESVISVQPFVRK